MVYVLLWNDMIVLMTVSPGRPRSTEIDRRILEAVAELAVKVGYSRLTVEEVARHAGTSKPAFYRRYADLSETVPILLATRFGNDEDVDTGSIVSDFLTIQLRQAELFNHPLSRNALCGYLDAISLRPEQRAPFIEGYLQPRRAFTTVVLSRAVGRGEIEPFADADYVADLLTGPVIMRALLPGMPPIDATLVRQTVNTVLNEVGFTGVRVALDDIVFPVVGDES